MATRQIEQGSIGYPAILHDRLGEAAPQCLYAIGNVSILQSPLLGLICSIKCPGSVVIKTFDAMLALRDAGVVVIGGFHSPMERDCLDILLRGEQPVILCAARGLTGLRTGKDVRQAIAQNRLVLMSQFDDAARRTTAAQAVQRNDMVAALSDVVLVPHAAPTGKAWVTVESALRRRQTVCTLEDEDNANLVRQGATAVDINRLLHLVCLQTQSG